MDKLRVLVIDDSQQIRDFVAEYVLISQGYEVEMAKDGVEGLHMALTHPPDLILTDFEMPRMTGPEVLRELNQRGSKIPAILMTSHGSEEVAIEVFRLGVQDYINKPFMPEDMIKAIEKALSMARLKREKEELTNRVIRANKDMELRLNELNILYQVGKSITTMMNPRQMLERIVDAVLFVVKADECVLALIDPKTGELKEHVKKGRSANKNQFETQLFSVPLQVGQKVVGNLSVSKHVKKDFSSHDDHLLRMLADYAAIAIHNLQLVYELDLNKEREKQQIRGVFERYVAPTVVQQMLAHPDLVKLGGTRETVSVLFADVRGFSTFSNRTAPEMLVKILNLYMQAAANVILDEEGTLDKFMGDAVMAFFNAPLPQPDFALRAVRAAWNLCQAVKNVHVQLPKEYHLNFGVGVGMGEAVVGNIGTPQMMNFTVMGDAVNKSKRLQENAKGGQILISAEVYNLVKDYIRGRSVGNILLKGQKKAELVYEVLAVNDSAS